MSAERRVRPSARYNGVKNYLLARHDSMIVEDLHEHVRDLIVPPSLFNDIVTMDRPTFHLHSTAEALHCTRFLLEQAVQ